MKLLLVSPLELPYTVGARYTGLERLAVQLSEALAKDHDVTLMAHKDTSVPDGVNLLPCEGYEQGHTIHAEQRQFQKYHRVLRDYEAIWDITHLNLIARFMVNMPIVTVFHANPEYAAMAGYTKAPYNLVSWSNWGVREIARYYRNGEPMLNGGQKAVYQETILIDPNVYKPKEGRRGNRFLTIGRMSPDKGNLNAAQLCKQLGVNLDIAGGRGSEVDKGQAVSDYEKAVMELCDGDHICYLGEVSDQEKVRLMQSCRGLLYFTDHVEITSHKVQEAMLCGAPVIIPNAGGMPEIVTHGVDGFLCSSANEYAQAIANVDQLNPRMTRKELATRYSPVTVANGYAALLDKVAKGERW